MAHVYNVGNSANISVAANTTTTVLQVEAPASRRLTLADFSISGISTDPAAATGTIWIFRKLNADRGTGTATAVVRPRDPAEPAALFAAREAPFTEGTQANWELAAGPFPLSPVSTLFAWQFAPGDEPVCGVNQALAVVARFGANQSVAASMTVRE
jgi:hypothetical protein